jgi:hypothetical protein
MPIKGPFPGLDPYLQQHWGDVHHSLIQYSRRHDSKPAGGGHVARKSATAWGNCTVFARIEEAIVRLHLLRTKGLWVARGEGQGSVSRGSTAGFVRIDMRGRQG